MSAFGTHFAKRGLNCQLYLTAGYAHFPIWFRKDHTRRDLPDCLRQALGSLFRQSLLFVSVSLGRPQIRHWTNPSFGGYDEVMKAKVIVMPKAAVLDPQGNAVRDAMRHLGMPEVRSVRIGKYMEIDIKGQNGKLEPRLHRLCRDLLSNPVIEDYALQKGEERNRKKTSNVQPKKGEKKPTRLRSPWRPTARQARQSSK